LLPWSFEGLEEGLRGNRTLLRSEGRPKVCKLSLHFVCAYLHSSVYSTHLSNLIKLILALKKLTFTSNKLSQALQVRDMAGILSQCVGLYSITNLSLF